MKIHCYEVIYQTEKGQWFVKFGSYYYGPETNKIAAVERAIALAKSNLPSEVKVFRENGTLEATYPYQNEVDAH